MHPFGLNDLSRLNNVIGIIATHAKHIQKVNYFMMWVRVIRASELSIPMTYDSYFRSYCL